MKIAILHGEVAEDACPDEKDVLVQVDVVTEGLSELGHEPVVVPVSLNLAETVRTLSTDPPAIVFNLVESLIGKGGLIPIVPALLEVLKIPYTGAGVEALLLTSNKILAKKWLTSAGLPTPPWFVNTDRHSGVSVSGPWLIKSVWEHASIGLDEDSVIWKADKERVIAEMDARCDTLGGACLAEAFIDGREFNLSLLADRRQNVPEVLPAAEIRFDAYPPGKIRVVGYRSKWEEGSFEYSHTPQSFTFPETDASLLLHLKELALRCWDLFDLRGYARVDFRVDKAGQPWILEINANPCLSQDAGFFAATREAGLTFAEVLERIIEDSKPKKG
jgi:D-alanine-D-alanine ligase